MPVDEPYNVYRERLSSLHHGYALWEPEPVKRLYDKVSIGDVGYVYNGFFYRMFNVTRSWDHPSNQKFRASIPDHYEPMKEDDFNDIHASRFSKGDYYSSGVSIQDNVNYTGAKNPGDAEGFRYQCQGPGALLCLPRDGHREEVIRTKAFVDYMRDNVINWFNWSRNQRLPVDAMEDLILVTGCTLVDSWAVVVFGGFSRSAEISLVAQTSDRSDRSFECSGIQGDVTQHCSFFDPDNSSSTLNQCVFIKGFRAKRRLFWTVPIRAAAESLPDDPDNNHEGDIQVTRVPGAPKYQDPLVGVLDYIVEKCSGGIIAIAHDDDLQLIENVKILTADAVKQFLNENQIPVFIANGAAFLRHPHVDATPIPNRKKTTFLTTAELEEGEANYPFLPAVQIRSTRPSTLLRSLAASTSSFRIPGDQTSNVYRVQLSSLRHGLALWDPNPVKQVYDRISIGDVGYVNSSGKFIRMFNVTLEWNDPLNCKLGIPKHYERLDCGPVLNSREMPFHKGDYCTPNVSKRNIDIPASYDAKGIAYKCTGPGALLSVPQDGRSEDVVHTKAFQDYIRNNVDMWFEWSQKNKLDVEHMEDLILVTGCTMVTSWAAATFLGRTATAEIRVVQRPDKNEESFEFTKAQGDVERHCSRFDPKNSSQNPDQCVFIRGFRAKRRLFFLKRIRAAAEPLPDDPDSSREGEVQATQVPSVLKDRDPVAGVLDYIAENCPKGTIAIAHDDDLRLVKNVEALTADVVEGFLRENEIPLHIENGDWKAAILNQHCDATPVPDEKKATFFATAELRGEPVPKTVRPVSTKYLLKSEIEDSVDPDYDLPEEGLTSAVHLPVPWPDLGKHQGIMIPQRISIQASRDSPNATVTVQDIFREIREDLRKPSTGPAWDRLRNDERVHVTSFKKRCKTEELSIGPDRIDYWCGKDRLQTFSKLSPDGVQLSPSIPLSAQSPESKVAGTSAQAGGSSIFEEGSGR